MQQEKDNVEIQDAKKDVTDPVVLIMLALDILEVIDNILINENVQKAPL